MNVKLISVTPDAEKLMSYCARVSNPNNQNNENYAKLLKYCKASEGANKNFFDNSTFE